MMYKVVSYCRYGFTVLHGIAFTAMDRLASGCFTGRFLVDRIIAFPAMTVGIDIFRFRICANTTGALLASLVGTIRRYYFFPVAEAMSQLFGCLMCSAKDFSATRTLNNLIIETALCAGCCYFIFDNCIGRSMMTCCRDFLVGAVIAVLAGIVCFPTVCGTGCRFCLMMYKIMSIGRDFVVADCAIGWLCASRFCRITGMIAERPLCCKSEIFSNRLREIIFSFTIVPAIKNISGLSGIGRPYYYAIILYILRVYSCSAVRIKCHGVSGIRSRLKCYHSICHSRAVSIFVLCKQVNNLS